MRTLTRDEVWDRLYDLLHEAISPQELSDWALSHHAAYESNQIALEGDDVDNVMFDTLIDLIHNEHEEFRLSPEEIREKLQLLNPNRPV